MVRFMSLASGSSGNCYYLASSTTAILIDAGIGVRTIKKRLNEFDIDLSTVKAVLVTHDHADHIRSVGCLGEKCFIPIYATSWTHIGINRSHYLTEKVGTAARTVEKEVPLTIGDLHIIPFEVPHDGTDNVGYFIEAEGKRFCFVTDIGHITQVVTQYACQANYLILEANYDVEMLRVGPYPHLLKERIAGLCGHLSNIEAANFLAEHYVAGWKYVWLCHLSKDNNTPELAIETVTRQLQEKGIEVGREIQVVALKRNIPSNLYIF